MPSSPFFAAIPSGEPGARSTTCCQPAGAGEILLAERADDTDVQQRLDVLGIDRERMIELLQRAIRLIRVVCATPRSVDTFASPGLMASACSCPGNRLRILLAVEKMLPSCTRARCPSGFCCSLLERGHARRIDRRRLRRGSRLLRRRRLGDRGRHRSAPRRLLAAKHPADDQSEQAAGNSKDNRVRSHGNVQDSNERRSQSTSERATSPSLSSNTVPWASTLETCCSRGPEGSAAMSRSERSASGS